MAAIKAHYDGSVFVPDEPVRWRAGEAVMVRQLGANEGSRSAGADVSFVRKLNIKLDARSLREIAQDPELGIESC